MDNLDRNDIHIISRNSNWNAETIQGYLDKYIYNNVKSWQNFLQILFLSLGVSFTVAGILFFFAYNWNNLHKFIKIGLIEGLLIVLTLIVVFSKVKPLFKGIILTGTSVLVGVLFAVFGQIYQTGANAYDFFFGWTLAIAIWVFISNFPPLWLIFILLINLTFGLYLEQVSSGLSTLLIYTIYSIGNSVFLFITLFLKGKNKKIPNWFEIVLTLTVVTMITFGMSYGIVDKKVSYFWVLFSITVILYGLGMYYGFTKKQNLYLASISFSVIIMISAILLKAINFDSLGVFFITGLFIIVSTTLVIKGLINLQKKWQNEKS